MEVLGAARSRLMMSPLMASLDNAEDLSRAD